MFTIELFWHLTGCKDNLYLYWTELAELELFEQTEKFKIEIFWQLKCVLMVNWIAWNRTDYFYKNWFGVK